MNTDIVPCGETPKTRTVTAGDCDVSVCWTCEHYCSHSQTCTVFGDLPKDRVSHCSEFALAVGAEKQPEKETAEEAKAKLDEAAPPNERLLKLGFSMWRKMLLQDVPYDETDKFKQELLDGGLRDWILNQAELYLSVGCKFDNDEIDAVMDKLKYEIVQGAMHDGGDECISFDDVVVATKRAMLSEIKNS